MNKQHAWKVEPKLIDRFLEVLADDGYKWSSGQWANQFKPLCSSCETTLFIEELPKTIMYLRYSYYPDKSDEEYNITEVTEESLAYMEIEGVTSTIVPESDSKDLWKLICGEEDDDVDNVDDVDEDDDVDNVDDVDEEDEEDEEDDKGGIDDLFEMLFGGHKIPDPVNHPPHYNHGGIETITIIKMLLSEEEYRGYLKGNILKYRERGPYKGNAEQDYAKAKWYFDELIRVGY